MDIKPITGSSGPLPERNVALANQTRARLLQFVELMRTASSQPNVLMETLPDFQSNILGLDSLSRSGGI